MTLETRTIRLRPPQESDIAGFCTIRRDATLQAQLMSRVDDASDAAVRQWLARKQADTNGVILSIADDAEFCGYVQLADVNRTTSSAYLGIAILPRKRGVGIGRRALLELQDHAKSSLLLFKLLLQVRADNVAAIGLYESLDYRRVGILAQHFADEKRRFDVLLFEKIL